MKIMEKQESNSEKQKEESITKQVLEAVWETIEELTARIAAIFKSDQDDLHDRENGF